MTEENQIDDKVNIFLDFLEKNIEENPQQCKPLDSDLISFINSIFVNEVIDIEAPIIDQN